jgi:branched-chain amino acid aminotransferase
VTVGAPELASVDGVVGPTAAATIALKDDGLYRGDGVFEVIRLYAGVPYRRADHLDRLGRSAAALELSVDRSALEAEIDALLAAAGPLDGQLRLIVTRGGRRIAATEPVPVHAETVTVASVEYQTTIILNGVKSLSYGANMQATRIAKAAGADEALLVRPDGIVLEPPTSTIFWVADGALCTPSLDNAILASITRERIVAMTDVEEGGWSLDELKAADEAFLASTTREIQAVASVDGVALPAAPGPRTRQVQADFAAMLRDELAGQ